MIGYTETIHKPSMARKSRNLSYGGWPWGCGFLSWCFCSAAPYCYIARNRENKSVREPGRIARARFWAASMAF
jgi:hypothetical protein